MEQDYEYHRARAAMEEARAEGAPPKIARAHRVLAELHRARSASFQPNEQGLPGQSELPSQRSN